MANLIMKVPNQQFCYMQEDGSGVDVEKDSILIRFTEPMTGTILLVTNVVEDDEDALLFFGVPDGENNAKIAFWPEAQEFINQWDKLVKAKSKCMQAKED